MREDAVLNYGTAGMNEKKREREGGVEGEREVRKQGRPSVDTSFQGR